MTEPSSKPVPPLPEDGSASPRVSPFARMTVAWARLPANIRGVGFAVAGGFILIVMVALVKHLGQTLPAFEVLFVRFLAGFIVMLPVIWRLGFRRLKTTKIYMHGIRGFVGFMGNLCFFLALIHMSIGDTVTIQFSRPLIMVVIAIVILGEAVGARRIAVTIVGFTGILMITRPFGEGFEPWALVALGGAINGSIVVLTIKLLSRTEDTLVIMFYFALFTTLFSFVPALFVWQTPSWTELALLVAAGALGIIGQSMFTHGIGLGETSFVMPFDYLRIVHSFVFGVIFFAEIPGFWSIAGAVVIVASSLYLLRTERKSPRP